jgi:hypothetical protein
MKFHTFSVPKRLGILASCNPLDFAMSLCLFSHCLAMKRVVVLKQFLTSLLIFTP